MAVRRAHGVPVTLTCLTTIALERLSQEGLEVPSNLTVELRMLVGLWGQHQTYKGARWFVSLSLILRHQRVRHVWHFRANGAQAKGRAFVAGCRQRIVRSPSDARGREREEWDLGECREW